jgi:hypothetical protein
MAGAVYRLLSSHMGWGVAVFGKLYPWLENAPLAVLVREDAGEWSMGEK